MRRNKSVRRRTSYAPVWRDRVIDGKSREKLIVESALKPVRVVAGKSAKRDGRDETKETRSRRRTGNSDRRYPRGIYATCTRAYVCVHKSRDCRRVAFYAVPIIIARNEYRVTVYRINDEYVCALRAQYVGYGLVTCGGRTSRTTTLTSGTSVWMWRDNYWGEGGGERRHMANFERLCRRPGYTGVLDEERTTVRTNRTINCGRRFNEKL